MKFKILLITVLTLNLCQSDDLDKSQKFYNFFFESLCCASPNSFYKIVDELFQYKISHNVNEDFCCRQTNNLNGNTVNCCYPDKTSKLDDPLYNLVKQIWKFQMNGIQQKEFTQDSSDLIAAVNSFLLHFIASILDRKVSKKEWHTVKQVETLHGLLKSNQDEFIEKTQKLINNFTEKTPCKVVDPSSSKNFSKSDILIICNCLCFCLLTVAILITNCKKKSPPKSLKSLKVAYTNDQHARIISDVTHYNEIRNENIYETSVHYDEISVDKCDDYTNYSNIADNGGLLVVDKVKEVYSTKSAEDLYSEILISCKIDEIVEKVESESQGDDQLYAKLEKKES